jgi:hypothetical protein
MPEPTDQTIGRLQLTEEAEELLFDIQAEMSRRGLPAMDDETLIEIAKRVQHPDILSAIQSGELTVEQIVTEVEAAIAGMQGAPPPGDVQGLPGATIAPGVAPAPLAAPGVAPGGAVAPVPPSPFGVN